MKNKKLIAILAMAFSASVIMTGCSLGTGSTSDKQTESSDTAADTEEETEETPAAEPTETPVPTETIAANISSATYTSADSMIAINLPDATWSSKTDETDTYSFESPDQGKILILHGSGTDTMAATVIPTTQDLAVSLEQAVNDKANGTDFEIQDYKSNDVNGIGVYSYISKILNTDKSDDVLYIVHKVFANDTEYYNIEADVKTEEALANVKASVDSFQILGDSTLAEAAPKQESTAASSDTKAEDNTSAESADTDAGTTDAAANTASDTSTSTDAAANTASDTSTDSASTNEGGFTDEQLSNTDESRTIYRNSDGKATVIKPDGNGNWVDLDGNSYTFTGEQDAYSADGTSYYWHGEAADVYYMPVE